MPRLVGGASRADGPCEHLSWAELACWNRLRDARGRPLSFQGIPFGELIAPYPEVYRFVQLPRLARGFEWIRAKVGRPITIGSAYRTPEYNRAIKGARASFHTFGRALDLLVPAGWTVEAFLDVCIQAAAHTAIRGVGMYRKGHFVHTDTRDADEVVVFDGERPSVEAVHV